MNFTFTYFMMSGASNSECFGASEAFERYEELVVAGASGIVIFIDGAAITPNTLRRIAEIAAERLRVDREHHQ